MFEDRVEAGQMLAQQLGEFEGEPVVVLALPRGGVPVGAEVARALGAPMDVIGVRKLGAPSQPELAVGAIAEGGVRAVDERTSRLLRLDASAIDAIEADEREELRRRLRAYRGDRELPDLRGRTTIVVDDGMATGSTARVACRAVRRQRPDRLILAIPVASQQAVESLREEADDVVCIEAPPDFTAVGSWYRNFDQTTDDDVVQLLNEIGTPDRRGP